jgi:hypothetical protein
VASDSEEGWETKNPKGVGTLGTTSLSFLRAKVNSCVECHMFGLQWARSSARNNISVIPA